MRIGTGETLDREISAEGGCNSSSHLANTIIIYLPLELFDNLSELNQYFWN
jgi:hypothetical protein